MNFKGLAIASTIFFVSIKAEGAEFNFTPSISTNVSYVERVTDDRESFFTSEFSPRALLTYRSSKLESSATIDNRNIYRDTDTNDYESYLTGSYNAQYEVFRQSLFLFASGSQQFNSVNSSNLLVDDLATNPNNLAKTRRNTGGVSASRLGNSWVQLSGNASMSLFESERSSQNESAFDVKSYQSSFNLSSGERFSFLRWNFTNSYQRTEREEDFDTERRVNTANVDFSLFEYFFLTIGARESKQDLSREAGLDTFRSYNAGIAYQTQRSNIRIAYNTVGRQSRFSDNDDSGFYSIDFNFQLSPRTSISGRKDQVFFGDTESFTFNYASRKLRLAASYSEQFTSNSTIFEDSVDGVFVCPDNFLTIDDCFVPDTINYQLQPGEQFADLSTFQDSINDSDRVRKSWVFNSGYQFNRITLSVQGRRLQSRFFDDTPDTLQHSISTNLVAQFGARTSLNAGMSYIKTEFNGEDRPDSESYLGNIGLSFRVRNEFTLGVQGQYRQLDSVGNIDSYQERRVFLTLMYSPGGRGQAQRNTNQGLPNNNQGIQGNNTSFN